MVTYYDALNAFHKLNEQTPLVSSAQLVYLYLLQLNNRSGNTGTVTVSDRELERRTSLNRNTITDAKRRLKNLGLIDFKTERGKDTTYTLTVFEVGQSLGQLVGHSVGQSIGHSFITNKGDTKTKDLDLDLKDNYTDASARASKEDNDLDSLLDYWELAGGCKLNQLLVSKLDNLLKEHGLEVMKTAIDAANSGANDPKYGFSFEYVKAKLKGGKKVGDYEYTAPDRTKRIDFIED